MDEPEATVEQPIPDLEPRPITLDEYIALTPRKLELVKGYLVSGPDHPDQRRNLLALLLVNEGLLESVRLAPAERWRAALAQVHGDP